MRSSRLLAVGFISALVFVSGARAGQAAGASAETRRQITTALSSAFPKAPAERKVQAEQFLNLYAAAADLPAIDRSRLRLRLKSRLTRLAEAIRKDHRPQVNETGSERVGANSSSSGLGGPTGPNDGLGRSPHEDGRSAVPSVAGDSLAVNKPVPASGLPGGGPQDEGQALVDLIEATIAPETWDVNGGPGVIRYWPAWHVLVVRQTDDVHEQIGGIVHGLRKR
jgi:hypothetical protein